jgi:hypothetical protein
MPLVDMGRDPVYLRHFMIVDTMRRRGYGRLAFELLHHQLGVIPLALDVLQTNPHRRSRFGSHWGLQYGAVIYRFIKNDIHIKDLKWHRNNR